MQDHYGDDIMIMIMIRGKGEIVRLIGLAKLKVYLFFFKKQKNRT